VADIPEKKKGAVGVRGMKLTAGDLVEAVYYTQSGGESVIDYGGKEMELGKLKVGKRDSRGVKKT
jgi:DNA gyrase subunit A